MSKNTLKLNPKEISNFCTQINYFLKAGIPVKEGIYSLLNEEKSDKYKKIYQVMFDKIDNGFQFAAAVEECEAFLPYVTNMIRIGEDSGKLEDVLNSITLYYERESSMNERIKSAVLYPAMLFVMMSCVVALLVFKVLPMFAEIFNQLGGQVSTTATAAMNFGITTGVIALVLIVVIFMLILAVIISTRMSHQKVQISDYLEKIPFTKDLAGRIAACRFVNALSLMLSSGIEFHSAVEKAVVLIENKNITENIGVAIKKAEENPEITLIDVISEENIFPGIFSITAKMAFKTGLLDELMSKLAVMYEEEINVKLSNFTAVIEPVLVGILSIIIGSILISVMLPLIGIMSSIG